jgi:hypothetical protein
MRFAGNVLGREEGIEMGNRLDAVKSQVTRSHRVLEIMLPQPDPQSARAVQRRPQRHNE